MSLLDDLAQGVKNVASGILKSIGLFARSVWEGVMLIFLVVFSLIDCILGLLDWCAEQIAQGWRLYQIDLDASDIPPHIISPEKLQGATKVNLTLLAAGNGQVHSVDRAVAHNGMDAGARNVYGNKDVIELVV